MKTTPIAAAVLALALCGAVQAQDRAQDRAADFAQRDANQQQRIVDGLKSGQLSVRAAGRLERQVQQIAEAQAAALGNDGRLDSGEQDRLASEQRALGEQIRSDRRDMRRANPNEVSTLRLAAVIQRSVEQQDRIARGLKSGELSNRDASRLERGQAQIAGMLADATANDGHFGGAELAGVENAQNRLGDRIYARNRDPRDRRDRDRQY